MNSNLFIAPYNFFISWMILIKHFGLIEFPNTLTFIHAIHSYKNQTRIDLYETNYFLIILEFLLKIWIRTKAKFYIAFLMSHSTYLYLHGFYGASP